MGGQGGCTEVEFSVRVYFGLLGTRVEEKETEKGAGIALVHEPLGTGSMISIAY